jgi:hypothetical protein
MNPAIVSSHGLITPVARFTTLYPTLKAGGGLFLEAIS